ncbi:mercuric transport protein MerTP [Taibaiella chishuiensis]|uniref:Mercuric transport protein MerT n=1 Tax=Taibaiella chishuiensis TaxID=1434707 RepID=A0A2P8D7K2_9BACT|nr:mercuric transport protein MerTP [Taibaiella chishuiensis]PSK93188.1 copper chaperone CopZ [Taibaiella chishuiensis]
MNLNLKIITGLGTALAASLCCIAPLLALLTGVSGMASAFSWLEPARPYCIAATVVFLALAWYRKLRPARQLHCNCEQPGKTKFIHSKLFLGIVTVLAGFLLAFPVYAHLFYPGVPAKPQQVAAGIPAATATFRVSGMTCASCGEHISSAVGALPGVLQCTVSYEAGQATVTWDTTRVNLTTIEKTINATGYTITDKNKP